MIQIPIDCLVVFRGPLEGFDGQAQFESRGDPGVLSDGFQDFGVIARVDDDGYRFVVFGGGSDQARPANVDVFDRFFQRAVRLQRHQAERVQIDYHQINVRNFELVRNLGILAISAPQDAAHDFRVQRFQSAAEAFRKTRNLLDSLDWDAGVFDHLGGAAGGDYFHAALMQSAGKFFEAGLVENTNQGSLDKCGHEDPSFS